MSDSMRPRKDDYVPPCMDDNDPVGAHRYGPRRCIWCNNQEPDPVPAPQEKDSCCEGRCVGHSVSAIRDKFDVCGLLNKVLFEAGASHVIGMSHGQPIALPVNAAPQALGEEFRQQAKAGMTCKAQRTADPPQDCGWPMCGCDPAADKVVAALQEMDMLSNAAVGAHGEQQRSCVASPGGECDFAPRVCVWCDRPEGAK